IVAQTTSSGAITPAWATDAIMVVVPDPTTMSQTSQNIALGDTALPTTGDVNAGNPCAVRSAGNVSFIYVVDHSSSSGAGRTHLLRGPPGASGTFQVGLAAGESTAFSIARGADVMCARISTYWIATPPAAAAISGVHQTPWLLRSDLIPG